ALNEIDSIKKPLEAIKVNIAESYRLISNAIAAKVKKFIFFSTAHVYCSPLKGIITESCLPRPLHPYANTHKAAEDFVLAARDMGQIDSIVLRLSNSFGVPAYPTADRWTLLVNDLCRQAILEKQLVLKSTGKQKRDFICLSDVVSAVRHLIKLDKHSSLDGVFNLGGGNSMRVIDMAYLVKRRYETLFNKEIQLIAPDSNGTSENDEELNFKISKLVSTGWEPTGNIEKEIDDTLSFCNKYMIND
ncbi:MAG: SDR family oxidoreductase, partial [Bacteroidota bacterium]|nr:SDR family oxidoreductase [Bacteroidota bacterium]